MAKSDTLIVALKDKDVTLYDVTNNINFNLFVNVPGSLVSGQGHNHDNLYMRTSEVDFLFKYEKDKVDVLSTKIEVLGYKTDVLMNGGGDNNDNKLRNYNINTETGSVVNATTPFNTVEGTGISFQRFGFFTNESSKISKYDHFTVTLTNINDTNFNVKASLIDFAVQSKGFIFDGNNQINSLNILLNTFSVKPNAAHKGNFRSGLSSFTFGYLKGVSGSDADKLKIYKYSSSTMSGVTNFNINSEVSGLQKNSKTGYWIGSNCYKHQYTTDSVSQLFGTTQIKSNNTANDIFGVLVSGSDSVTSNKLTFSTDTFSTMTDNITNTTSASYIEV